ncbi:S-adenosyl-L-methionine-dependent methyltransferase [Bombardia bombarda]|uniref:S-adenosyl-L-methionine-dependent methyltransferase n=1 Tax=Bombardia bombarda TaxID=252184 RepID=A0AA39X8R6_9PEZI|nr:S-adenosyl-L-methionine-dependent methyltransferase [Bombardia bombarda]
MSQNIYDSAGFFESYSKMPRGLDGLKGASEWPLLRSMLPRSIRSMSVLDLGCGDGWFCRWAISQGASKACGMDVSKNMLERARELSLLDDKHSAARFCQGDMEDLLLDDEAYDIVFSGLALHYIARLEAVIQQVYKSLRPGGHFVFSVEHPVFTAPRRPGFSEGEPSEAQSWLLSDYFAEGERTVDWLGASVQKQHHTLSSYLRTIRLVGFKLTAVDEWGATDEESRKHPDWPNDGAVPRFLLVSARKSPSENL